MSGHNKWSQIQRQKGVNDAKRSQLFGKIAREIALAARKGPEQATNSELRRIIDKARTVNMPKENIERAVEKGSGGTGGNLEAVRYEAYGPGGVAMLVDAITDNKNRTVAEVKHTLAKLGGSFAGAGAAAWAFETGSEGVRPKTTVSLAEGDGATLTKLIEALEELEDVQTVHVNAE